MRPLISLSLFLGFSICLVGASCAEDGERSNASKVALEIYPLRAGIEESAFGKDRKKLTSTAVWKAGERVGIDLPTDSGLLELKFSDARLFYLFYNTAKTDEKVPYLVQRIHKRITNIGIDGEKQVVNTYLVEAFKLKEGQLKRPDQHFGVFSLQGYEKRIIEKEFEIGIPVETDNKTPTEWPFDPKVLYHRIDGYSKSKKEFDAVTYRESTRWTLRATFDANGNYSLEVPELGVRVIYELPAVTHAKRAEPVPVDDQVLIAGQGIYGAVVGKTSRDDIEKLFGKAQAIQNVGKGSKNYVFANGLTCNFLSTGLLNTIFAEEAFQGKTDRGIAVGDSLEKVQSTYGKRNLNRGTLSYPGILFWFSDEKKVNKIVVHR